MVNHCNCVRLIISKKELKKNIYLGILQVIPIGAALQHMIKVRPSMTSQIHGGIININKVILTSQTKSKSHIIHYETATM